MTSRDLVRESSGNAIANENNMFLILCSLLSSISLVTCPAAVALCWSQMLLIEGEALLVPDIALTEVRAAY